MVSVIIPVFNTDPSWLNQSVFSMQNQTMKSEILLIDDASTNKETVEALNRLDEFDDVEVIRLEKNKGISGALNIGISESKFDIIARMDSDDYSVSDRLKKQFDYLQQNSNVDLVGTDLAYMIFHENQWKITNQRTNHPHIITKESARNSLWFLNHPTVMFRKKSVLDVGGYDESLRGLAEDYELWIRMLRNDKVLHNINDVDLFLRINPNSLMGNIKKENHEFQLKLQKTL
jgi:glycosyltransferase involved in cell wall biosynthesis